MREIKAVLAGFGGQGVLFAGKVLTYCGMIEDRELSWLPSYGPEMRGGTANCSVTISDKPIGSPLVLHPNCLIAMNQPSLDKFIGTVEPGGFAVVDSSMVNDVPERADITICAIPATKMAEEAGLKGLANIVLLGKLFALTQFCEEATLDAAIDKCVPAKKAHLAAPNTQALRLGMDA